MTDPDLKRRLAAILAADVAGYSRLMADDDRATVLDLDAARSVFRVHIEAHRGRVIDMAGDSILATFQTAAGAVDAAIAVQHDLARLSNTRPEHRRMQFRVGVHIGDIIEKPDGSVYGDGVNIAARLESVAYPGGIAVSDMVHATVRERVKATFADAGEHRVKNIAHPVRVYRIVTGSEATSAKSAASHIAPLGAEARFKFALRDRPSLAVLPFPDLSGDRDQEYFADGLVEDLITTLSKISGLVVIARNSSFSFKGSGAALGDIAQQLGVRYVLQGSVRRAGSRARITAQLVDSESGVQVWAERYDRAIDDIFAVQDEITLTVATEMQVHLTEGEQARLRYSTVDNVEAWNHWARGLTHFHRSVTRDALTQALKHWLQAVDLDPRSASLHAMLALLYYLDARFGLWEEREVALRKAADHVDRALLLDQQSADAHMSTSLLLLLRGQYDAAIDAARRAVEYGPGSADIASFAAFVLANAGLPDEAVSHMERAMALCPIFPPYYLGHLGNAYRHAGRIDEAVAAFEAYHQATPGRGVTDLVIIAQERGQSDVAAAWARTLLATNPGFGVASWIRTQFRRDRQGVEADARRLREAGLPE